MNQVIAKRYVLGAKIGEGGMGVVYKAEDRLATTPAEKVVALKRVTTPAERLDFDSRADSVDFRLALAQEFKTLSSLRHPNIISVLDYGFDEDQVPYYTMDYIETPKTIVEVSHGKSMTLKLSMLVQVLQALEYLHRRGIIHRDLKPANVLARQISDNQWQIKVVDFGLAIINGQAEEDQTVGTLAYMAPEILLGAPASPASDLYAFGIIACEVLGERHPHPVTDPSTLVTHILNNTPNVDDYDLDERLTVILKRLVARDPADRFQNALQILHAYNETLGQGQQIVYETRATRESFLQAADFVGRKRELGTLSDHLTRMLDTRRGSAWLIGGESGVGKTRLLDEIRAQAQVRGVRLLRGQAITEKAGTYYLWREILRWLALAGDPTPFEASVLKSLVPDIEALIGSKVDDAPEISSQAAQERLLLVVEALFRRQTQPHMLMLEDLHWAQGNLDLLQRLNELTAELPLMILGSYRDDERPDLPALLPAMHVMKLERLTRQEIAMLSESMLGASGNQTHVVDLLQRETEGNVFFLVEVVRTLAEDAGRLDLVGKLTLPERVFAGGVQRVVERRLSHLPPEAYELLYLTALIGRQLDLPTMQSLLQRNPTLLPGSTLDMWLTMCSDATIIAVEDGKWQFTHDRLREGVLARIEAARLPAMHQQIAAALEQAHPNAYARLAYHYRRAGDMEKEAHYAGLEGEQELANGAYQSAIDFLDRALKGKSMTDQRRAHLEQLMGDALYGMGKLAESYAHSENALKLLGYPMPSSDNSRIIKLLRQITRQLVHRMFPKRMIGSKSEKREILLEACRAYERLSVINYMFNNTISTVLSTLYSLNLAEQAGPSPELARSSANVGIAVGLVLPRATPGYMERGLEAAEDSLPALRWVRALRGVYATGIGDLQVALDETDLASAIAREIGDERGYEEALVVNGSIHHHMGNFAAALQDSKTLYQSGFRRGDLQNYDSGLVLHLAALVRTGDLEAALKICQTLEERLPNSLDQGHRISGYGSMAQIYLKSGQIDAALKAADQMTAIAFQNSPTSYYSYFGYVYVTDLYLTLWEQGKTEYRELAEKMVKQLKAFASPFPLMNPARYRYEGWRDQLLGKPDAAQAAWQKALKEAEKLAMVYEQMAAHQHLGNEAAAAALRAKMGL